MQDSRTLDELRAEEACRAEVHRRCSGCQNATNCRAASIPTTALCTHTPPEDTLLLQGMQLWLCIDAGVDSSGPSLSRLMAASWRVRQVLLCQAHYSRQQPAAAGRRHQLGFGKQDMLAPKHKRHVSCTPLTAGSSAWNPKCRRLAWPVAGSKQPPPKPCVLPRLTAFLSVVHPQPLICQQVHPDVPLQVLH